MIPTQIKSIKPTSIRFTKVLTKYSTEYNNQQFIISFCRQLNMDKKDLFSYISLLCKQHTEDEICQILSINDINKLDIKRMLRYMNQRYSMY